MADDEKSLQDLPYNERLQKLRERSGLSQYDLGELAGISWRMIYYYEKETTHPPVKLMEKLCSALGVTADEYLGINPVPERNHRTIEGKLLKKFCQIKELPSYQKRALFQVMKAFLDAEELKKRS